MTGEQRKPKASPATIPATTRVVAAVTRRLRQRAGVNAAGRSLAVAGLVGLGLAVAGWWWVWGVDWWMYPAGVVALAVLLGVIVAALSRVRAVSAAGLLDDRLGYADRLSSAVEFAGEQQQGFERVAIADAERVATEANVRTAVPIVLGRGWIVGGVLLLAMIGTGVGLPGRTEAIRAQREAMQADRLAASERIREAREAIEELAPLETVFDDAQPPRAPQDEGTLRTFEELERELASGEVDPQEALAEAAAELEEQAETREARADAAERQGEELEESLRAIGEDGPESTDFGDARDLASRLADGDLEGAREAMQDLREQAREASPEERERIAEQMQRLADEIDHTAADAQEQSSENRSGKEPAGQQPNQQPSQQPGEATDPSEALENNDEGQSPPSDEGPSDSVDESSGEDRDGREGDQPRPKDIADAIRREAEQIREPAEPNQPEEGQPGNEQQPGDQPQPGDEQQPGDQPQPGNEQQPGDQPQPGDEQKPGDQPKPGDEQQPGDQPQPGNEQQPGDQPQPGDEQQPGDQPQPGDEQQPGDQPQPGDVQQPGDQPQPGDEQQPGDQPKPGDEQQPGDQPQPGDEQQPGDQTDPSGQQSFDEVIKQAQDARDGAAEDRRQARELRDQSDKLLDRESKPGRSPSTDDQVERDRWSRAMDRERGDPSDPRGAGRDPNGEEPKPLPPTGEGFDRTDAVDARPQDAEGAPQTISEWLGDGQDGEYSPEGREQMRDAVRSAERAVEQQRVPTRHEELIRRVFRRWQQRAEGQPIAPLGQDASPAQGPTDGEGDGP